MAKRNIKIPQGRDGLWFLIRSFRRFTVSDLCRGSKMERSSIKTYLRILMKSGHLVMDRYGIPGQPDIYRLVIDCGAHRPAVNPDGSAKAPSSRQRMWMGLKALRVFTHKDVSLAAQVPDIDAKDYVGRLARAGYLATVEQGKALSLAKYRLVKTMDTGPKAPVIRNNKSVYDPNLNRVVWPVNKIDGGEA